MSAYRRGPPLNPAKVEAKINTQFRQAIMSCYLSGYSRSLVEKHFEFAHTDVLLDLTKKTE